MEGEKQSGEYCVYLTVYRGNKLPPFYIGSSSVSKVDNGYRGSVSSARYKKIWKHELKNNPDRFKTKIIKTFVTRQDALDWEYKIQKKLAVVDNQLYCNLWYACGIFGYQNSGKNHPFYGKKLWDEKNPNPFKGKKHSEQTKAIISRKNKGRKATQEMKAKMSEQRKGKKQVPCSESKKNAISKANSRFIWITNGIITLRHESTEPIPDGFCRGRKLTIAKKKRCWE